MFDLLITVSISFIYFFGLKNRVFIKKNEIVYKAYERKKKSAHNKVSHPLTTEKDFNNKESNQASYNYKKVERLETENPT